MVSSFFPAVLASRYAPAPQAMTRVISGATSNPNWPSRTSCLGMMPVSSQRRYSCGRLPSSGITGLLWHYTAIRLLMTPPPTLLCFSCIMLLESTCQQNLDKGPYRSVQFASRLPKCIANREGELERGAESAQIKDIRTGFPAWSINCSFDMVRS